VHCRRCVSALLEANESHAVHSRSMKVFTMGNLGPSANSAVDGCDAPSHRIRGLKTQANIPSDS
jgi:hypothetical protein